MRTFSGFLLLEDVLDYAPTDNQELYSFVQRTIRPTVKILEEDCQTKIGKNIEINFEIQGYRELATDLPISKARIEELLTAGIYFVAVRSLFSCVTAEGVCRACYSGTYIDQVAPDVGTYKQLEPEYNFQTDLLIGTGITSVFTLSQSPDTYTKVLVVIDGDIQIANYTVSGTSITFNTPPTIGTHVVVKFMRITAQPYLGYLSKTYTGSLLGMQSLPTQDIIIKPSLAQKLFTEEELNIAKDLLQTKYRGIVAGNLIEYTDTIQDKLEKALFISTLYGFYSNVSI
jgi:hypothetical protein